MGNSGNVLRGGLTSKPIDVPELLRILQTAPTTPRVMTAQPAADGEEVFLTEFQDFRLSRLRLRDGPTVTLRLSARRSCSASTERCQPSPAPITSSCNLATRRSSRPRRRPSNSPVKARSTVPPPAGRPRPNRRTCSDIGFSTILWAGVMVSSERHRWIIAHDSGGAVWPQLWWLIGLPAVCGRRSSALPQARRGAGPAVGDRSPNSARRMAATISRSAPPRLPQHGSPCPVSVHSVPRPSRHLHRRLAHAPPSTHAALDRGAPHNGWQAPSRTTLDPKSFEEQCT
jgi:hypothetical protein